MASDRHGKHNKPTIAFRVTPYEQQVINERIIHVNTILYPNISLMNVIKIFWKFVRKANVSGLVGLTWLQVIKDNYF